MDPKQFSLLFSHIIIIIIPIYPAHWNYKQGLGKEERRLPLPIKEDAAKESLGSKKILKHSSSRNYPQVFMLQHKLDPLTITNKYKYK